MSKLPWHTTRIASVQRLQHWLTRGQGFAADCPPPQCRACCKPGGKANDAALLLPLCDANTPICLVSEPPARSAHSHPPIEWLFALRGQKTEKSIWRDATDAVALARQPLARRSGVGATQVALASSVPALPLGSCTSRSPFSRSGNGNGATRSPIG